MFLTNFYLHDKKELRIPGNNFCYHTLPSGVT